MIVENTVNKLTIIKIDRPERRNALTAKMLDQLTAAFDSCEKRGDHAVILTGTGAVFSAGADLEEAHAGLAVSPRWEVLSQRVASLPALTVAALNGTLAGGAFGMALACDIRIGVAGASFFYPVMKLGFLPQPSDPARMAALIGPSRAKFILMGGARIKADEALEWGLVDRLVAPDSLMDEARAICLAATEAPEGHVAAMKAAIG